MHDSDADRAAVARLREARDVLTAGLDTRPASVLMTPAAGAEPVADVVAFESKRRRRWPVVLGTAAATAACALAVAVTPQLIGSASPGDSGAGLSAANLAAATGANYVYLRTDNVSWDGSREVTELWIPRDPSGNWMYRHKSGSGRPLEISGLCTAFRPARSCSGAGNWKDITPDFVAALPLEPVALEGRLRAIAHAAVFDPANSRSEQQGLPSDREAERLEMTVVQNILESGYAGADLTRVLAAAVAHVPGVTVVRPARNGNGATGTGYVVPTPDENGATSTTAGALVFDARSRYIGTTGDPAPRRDAGPDIPYAGTGSTVPAAGSGTSARPYAVLSVRGTVFATGTASAAGGAPLLR